jgi:hypothetical protein
MGPYSVEELKALAVTQTDYVWKVGLSKWMLASTIPELDELFSKNEPPPFKPYENNNYNTGFSKNKENSYSINSPYKNENSTSRYIPWVIIISLLAIVSYFIYTNTQSNSYVSPNNSTNYKTPEQLRAELVEKERQNPSQYLSDHTTMRENLIDQKVIEGTITNTASVAAFKDMVLEVNFLSKTQTAIATKNFTIYELIEPHQTVKFKFKTYAPSETEKFEASIINATATN